MRAGLAAVALCLVLGNLAGVREWLQADDPPGDYDWFGASRVIPDTINEFPSFSFMLGDLHAHVLALPFTLLALALRAAGRARRAARRPGAGARSPRRWPPALARRRALRDQLVVLSGRRGAAGRRRRRLAARTRGATGGAAFGAVWLVLVLVASVVLVLPFWLDFDPAARGIGAVDRAPRRSRAGPAT